MEILFFILCIFIILTYSLGIAGRCSRISDIEKDIRELKEEVSKLKNKEPMITIKGVDE